MAEAILGPLVSKLQELALSEGKALVSVRGDIHRLRDKLMWLQAFLQEADPWRRCGRAGELARVLVHQTRDAAFSAEDAIDEYLLRVDLSRYPGWSRAALGFLTSFTTQLRVRHCLSREIAVINSRLEEIISNKEKYMSGDSTAAAARETWAASAAYSSASDSWGIKKPPMIGREKDEAKLEGMLLHPPARFAVMYVVGESGIGKTTLVNTVYAKPTIREHFRSSAIVKVQRNFCLSKIIELICERFMQKEKPNIATLRKTLTGQRYLLVIDGRHMAVADWNSVIHVLPKDEAGSRVVLITKKVPTFLDRPNHEVRDIKVMGLDFLSCRKLFNSRLHGDEEDRPDYQEGYYERVHSITGGSPLAIILLSGLMRTKEYPIEWDNVFKYLESIQSKRLDRILSLSFDDLSNELKLCFLYFMAFPQGYKASRNTLVNLWIAEGFLAARDGKTAEQVGHIYLSELIARGLVDEVAEDDTCRMSKSMALHSRVYVFARSEARESNFMEMHDGDYIPAPATVRRLTLQNDMDRCAALTGAVPKLRTIIGIFQEEKRAPSDERPTPLCTDRYSRERNSYMPKSKFDMVNLLEGSKFLRVIKLEGVEIGAELPRAIGNMVHLRYLALRCRSLTAIPASIGKLTNLETLDVMHSSVRELPSAFWYITSLRHVTGFKLAMPTDVGILKHIQTLSSIRTSEDWEGRNLAKMVHLKTLNVIVEGEHQEESAKALLDNLNKLDYLTTLVLEGTGLPMSIFTGPSLHRLQNLRLTRTVMHSLPPLTQDDGHGFQLPNLSRLSLTRTSLPEGFIEKLAELPLLTELELKEISYQGELLVFRRNGFESLRKLEIENARKNISIEEFALPRLQSMQVLGCTDDFELNIHRNHQIKGKVKMGEKMSPLELQF